MAASPSTNGPLSSLPNTIQKTHATDDELLPPNEDELDDEPGVSVLTIPQQQPYDELKYETGPEQHDRAGGATQNRDENNDVGRSAAGGSEDGSASEGGHDGLPTVPTTTTTTMQTILEFKNLIHDDGSYGGAGF